MSIPDDFCTANTGCSAFQEDVARAGLKMHHLLREQDAEIEALRLDVSELAWTIRQLVLAAGDTVTPDLVAALEEVVG